ncbi:FAD-binding protein [Spirosoma taeanense]|uniref:FAD-binding protein n=1 Tax=Spirosoma taeanense TaxID=2735870 RepID=A0A6M5Y9I8_9BACT|nr:FAD-binding protein [Spirosoma taeanense]QJW89472.1 FAD-binding protein [Spirosoma taeanense]
MTTPNNLDAIAIHPTRMGFDLSNRTWAPDSRTGNSWVGLPAFEGQFSTDGASLAAVADDYGHLIHRTPTAVLRPASVDDVTRMVQFARQHGIRIVSRGNGHTTYGQSQVEAGVVIDLRSLNQIHAITSDQAVVGGGVIWRDLLLATLNVGLTPPVLTDYTRLTIGGTLSMGGVSGRSFQYGAQVDNVLELQVVTGEGQLITCSEETNRPLFEAVLAGLGQCAIIVRATIRLIPAKQHARTLRLFYADVPTMLIDLRLLTTDQRFDHIRGNSMLGGTPEQPSTELVYFLEATSFYNTADELPTDALTDLHFRRGSEQTEEMTYFAYTDLVSELVNTLEGAGLNSLPHPWLDLFVPDSAIDQFASEAVAALDPTLLLPGSIILFFPFVRSQLKRPMLRVPDEELFYLFDILLAIPPSPDVTEAILAQNRRLYEQNCSRGGTFYTISAVPMTRADWAAHFQPVWPDLVRAKQTHDPDNILGAGLSVFDSAC